MAISIVVNAGIVNAVREPLLDISDSPMLWVYSRHSKDNFTIKDTSKEYGLSTRTIYRKLTKSYKKLAQSPYSSCSSFNGTYCGHNWGIVIIKDSLSGDVLWHKFINRHEHFEDYKEDISYLN